MSDLLPPPRVHQPMGAPDPARTLDTLATIVISVLTISILYLARQILVPVAIAILLSFVLAPLVKFLRSLGLGKTLSVGSVVLLTFLVAIGLGAILAKQISDLAEEAPKYQATITQKVEAAQAFLATSPVLGKLETVIADVGKMSPPPPQKAPDAAHDKASPTPPGSRPVPDHAGLDRKPQTGPLPVEIVSPAPGVLTILQTALGIAVSPLATAAFVAIFIVFILMQREDLRNRFIRLVGFGDLQLTTLAMNDAARRLSRYFLAQVLLNTAFGVIIAAALTVIGVPSAILWGIVATFMRFIPYIGAVGAALLPVTMAAVASSGWGMVVETLLLFALMEFIVGQIIEPLFYGHHTGISPIAVVASATFWTWLWGPVGLVLSTPLTVCLVVMGRHVDRLAFLDVLLGDAPPLTPVETFYQRMLAGDPSEILDHAETYLNERSLLDYCDKVAMKALLMAQTDVRRGVLDEARQTRICDTMRDLVDDLADQDDNLRLPAKIDPTDPPAALEKPETAPEPDEAAIPPVEVDSAWTAERSVLCVAGRTPLDEAAAHLIADLLRVYGIGSGVERASSLTAQDATHLACPDTRLLILSFLDADLSIAHARFAVRRLKRRVPGVPVVAAFWMAADDQARAMGLCSDVRADFCVSSLPQMIALCLEKAAAEPTAATVPAVTDANDEQSVSAKLQLSSIV